MKLTSNSPKNKKTVDLSDGARRTVRLDADAVRARVRPDLRDALIPADATVIVAGLDLMHGQRDQICGRLEGHTAFCVPQEARR